MSGFFLQKKYKRKPDLNLALAIIRLTKGDPPHGEPLQQPFAKIAFRFTVAVPLALLRLRREFVFGQLGAVVLLVLLEAVPPCSFEEAAGSVALEPVVANININ